MFVKEAASAGATEALTLAEANATIAHLRQEMTDQLGAKDASLAEMESRVRYLLWRLDDPRFIAAQLAGLVLGGLERRAHARLRPHRYTYNADEALKVAVAQDHDAESLVRLALERDPHNVRRQRISPVSLMIGGGWWCSAALCKASLRVASAALSQTRRAGLDQSGAKS